MLTWCWIAWAEEGCVTVPGLCVDWLLWEGKWPRITYQWALNTFVFMG